MTTTAKDALGSVTRNSLLQFINCVPMNILCLESSCIARSSLLKCNVLNDFLATSSIILSFYLIVFVSIDCSSTNFFFSRSTLSYSLWCTLNSDSSLPW